MRPVVNGSEITTNGFSGYTNLTEEGYAHKILFSPEMLPWVHVLISNVKTSILGTYHGVSNKYLRRYFQNIVTGSIVDSGNRNYLEGC